MIIEVFKTLKGKKYLSAGFEPARGDPNGFLVHRLNRSATTTSHNISLTKRKSNLCSLPRKTDYC